MKTLHIIRHAKSDQSFFGNDLERPLNARGLADAPIMAKRLLKNKIKIDALFSSPATRAYHTALAFAEVYEIPVSDIILVSALYHASPEVLYDVVSELPDELNDIAIFSHNPGITYFVNSLTADFQIGNMPTCGIVSVSASILTWDDLRKSNNKHLIFDYPKSSK